MTAVALAILSMIAGLMSAFYWFRSAKCTMLAKNLHIQNQILANRDGMELEANIKRDGQHRFEHEAIYDNEKAALWTAVAVVLGAASNLLNVIFGSN